MLKAVKDVDVEITVISKMNLKMPSILEGNFMLKQRNGV
jgi:hypothetical protein